ncbi:histidine kinase [Yinghuangia sp. ASG 101]|nr:histidine kinase [Yinghuangia sp. ASG 101]
MTVQASAAQRTIARNPDRAREAMAAVEQTGRAALVEMRRLVGILRGNEDEAGGTVQLSEGHNAPQPGLDALEILVQQVREAGVPVELSIEGVPSELPPGIDLAAYRIIQEALTNTLKHAGPAGSRVLLRYRPEELLVRVADDGRGAAANLDARDDGRTGHGLLGMRERVALYGGRLYAGPRAGGGFEVLARIPLTPGDRPQPPRHQPAAARDHKDGDTGRTPGTTGDADPGERTDPAERGPANDRGDRTDRLEQNPA